MNAMALLLLLLLTAPRVLLCPHLPPARSTLTVDPSVLSDPVLVAEAQGRVARVLNLLSLTGCANTILGDELVKGVSGCGRG